MAQLEDEAAQSTSALGPLIGLTREDIFGAVAVMLRETASDPQRLMKHGQDMGQDMVTVSLQDANSSALITNPEFEGFKYVVMPMRI